MVSPSHNNICTCFGVPKHSIVDAIRTYNIKGVDQVTKVTCAGAGCGSCRRQIRNIIDQVRRDEQLDAIEAKKYQQPKAAAPVIPVIKQLRLINDIVEKTAKAKKIKIKFNSLDKHQVNIEFVNNNYAKQASIIEALQDEIETKVIKGLVVVAK